MPRTRACLHVHISALLNSYNGQKLGAYLVIRLKVVKVGPFGLATLICLGWHKACLPSNLKQRAGAYPAFHQ
jgi:hypothetical protein